MGIAWMAITLASLAGEGAGLEAESRWADAAAVYRSALAMAPVGFEHEQFWFAMNLVEVAYETRDYRDARRWLSQAVRIGDKLGAAEQGRVLNASGTLHMVEGELTAAERDLSQAAVLVEGATDRASTLHNLASLELQSGRLPEARTHETEAIQLWSASVADRDRYVMKAWAGLATIEALSGNWRSAEVDFRRALAIVETPEVWTSYAVVLEKLDRRREARDIRRRIGVLAEAKAASALVDVKALAHETERPPVNTR